jgi:glycosyltransferase involved in cell wall biosynthesis
MVWAGKLRGKPVIMHVHGADFDTFYHHSFSFVRYYIRKTFSACSKVLVLSGYWKGFFDNFIYQGNTEILHNGVYTHVFKPCNTAPSNITKFLFLGRLGQRKGVYDLLEVITRLVNIYPQQNLTFYLAGDGELEQVKAIIKKNNLGKHVQLLGWLNETEKMKWLKQVDTIVLPSYNEGLPMAILEAMAGGKIIISSKVGGIPDLVKEGENGFLIQPGDIENLEKFISYVYTHPAEMIQISHNNIKKIEDQYNLTKINGRLAEIYQEISA